MAEVMFEAEMKEPSDFTKNVSIPDEVDAGVPEEQHDGWSMHSKVSNEDSTELAEESNPNECKITNWRLVIIATVLSFLINIQGATLAISDWPYMKTLDDKATPMYFGLVNSLSKVCHAIFAMIFTFFVYKTQNIRIPLIIGRCLAILTCILYLFVEYIPTNRRFLLGATYSLFAIGGSSGAVLRQYLVQISTKEDRARAYSALALSIVLSIIIGPVIQLAFSGIKYPGVQVLPHLYFNIFSAPIWIALITDILSLLVIVFLLEPIKKNKNNHKGSLPSISLEYIKEQISKIRALHIVWYLVIICWIQKIVLNLAGMTLQAMMTPFIMIAYGWSADHAVTIISICMAVVGVVALTTVGTLMTPCVGTRLSSRFMFLVSMFIMISLYVLSYPYPGISTPMPSYNQTEKSGCDPNEHSWCSTATATLPGLFLGVVIAVSAIGTPLGMISVDTIYSKILGNIDQSVLQGAMVVAEDIILIIGPVYGAWMFTDYGQSTLWIANFIITTLAIILWLAILRKLKKYQ